MFSNQDPLQQDQEGTITIPAIITIGDIPVPETPVCLPTSATDRDAERTTQGINAPTSPLTQKGLGLAVTVPGEGKSHLPGTTPGGTNKYDDIITPVNVPMLKKALFGHPNRSFVNKLCSELTEGARIGYSGPRAPRFSNNLATAFENPAIISKIIFLPYKNAGLSVL